MANWRTKLSKLVSPELSKLDQAHQIAHSFRVYDNCEKIAVAYKKVDLDVLFAVAMTHDLGQTINNFNEHSDNSVALAHQYLSAAGFPEEKITLVNEIISEHDNYAWVKNHKKIKPKCLESKIFQDADRLEGLGVIGIIRQFLFAGKHGKIVYNPKLKPRPDLIYGGNLSAIHTIRDHQLNIYKNLNTKKAKELARESYNYTKLFLKQFFKEWH